MQRLPLAVARLTQFAVRRLLGATRRMHLGGCRCNQQSSLLAPLAVSDALRFPAITAVGNPYGDEHGVFGDNQFRYALLSLAACEAPLQLQIGGYRCEDPAALTASACRSVAALLSYAACALRLSGCSSTSADGCAADAAVARSYGMILCAGSALCELGLHFPPLLWDSHCGESAGA